MIQSWDRYCYVNADRGCGSELHEVVEYGARETKVRNTRTKQVHTLYNVHLTTSVESKIKSAQARKASAQAISRPKVKPGKK